MTYSFLRKKLDEYILIGILVFSIPTTVFIARHIQNEKRQTDLQCLPKPTCMVAAPFCYLSPQERNCSPKAAVKKATVVIHESCGECLIKGFSYLCSNLKTGLRICKSGPIIEKGYSCIVCSR